MSENDQADLAVLGELVAAGKYTLVIDRTCPPDDAADAIRFVSDGRARGEVDITV